MRSKFSFVGAFFILILNSFAESFRFYDLPEIKVEKWIASSVWELEENFEQWHFEQWNSDFTDIPQDAIKIIERGATIVVSQHISGLGIVCNASYPVEWTFDQAEHADEEVYNIFMKTARESQDISNPRGDRFIAILELFGDNPTITGNYTCRGLNTGMEKSVFVFWDGSSPPFLTLSGRTVHVYPEDNKLILPCFVSQPEIPVTLSYETNGTFQQISEGGGVKYDPKVGFILNLNAFPNKEAHARYKCNTEVEDDEVNLIVERGLRPQKHFTELISPGTGIFYDPEQSAIVCCARKGQPPPSLHNIFCVNPSTCKMKEHKLYRAGNNGKKIINGSCISDKVYMRDYGILRCKGDGIDIFRTVYTDFGSLIQEPQGIYFNFKDVVPEKMMHLTVHDHAPYYHMQTISVTCEGMNSYFSDGHKWSVRWRNNSVTSYQPIEYIDDAHIHGLRFVDVHLHWKMLELICHIPVWNTTDWVSRSVKLDVQKSSPPAIAGESLQHFTFALNETEKLLECNSAAKPAASVTWTKNGEDIPKNMIILNESGTSVIMIRRITHDSAAEYKCIAKNIVGETTKIIRVFVEDNSSSSSSAWGTTAAVLVPLLIVGFVLTAGGLFWKMQLQKKIVNHLSRVVFRDSERQNEYPA